MIYGQRVLLRCVIRKDHSYSAFLWILTTNLTTNAVMISIFILKSPNFTKKSKKISSNSFQHVVELRRCDKIQAKNRSDF